MRSQRINSNYMSSGFSPELRSRSKWRQESTDQHQIQKSRIIVFDYIKVTMKIFIIVTHVPLITSVVRAQWLFPLWIDQAVPFFWMISAFLFMRAFERHGSSTPADELAWCRIWPRLKRVLVPYAVVFCFLMALVVHRSSLVSAADALLGVSAFSSRGVVSQRLAVAALFAAGGPGPGGYYISCLVQMYIILPFLCAGMRSRPVLTISLCLMTTAAVETAACVGLVSPQAYRLIIARYLPHLVFGALLARLASTSRIGRHSRLSALMAGAALLGAAYLAGISYLGLQPVGVDAWKATGAMSVLWSGPLLYFALAVFGGQAVGGTCEAPRNRAVEHCSKAALHIYIFQMLWYYAIGPYQSVLSALPLVVVVTLCVFACMAGGLVHYSIETFIRNKIRGLVR